jgi:hypothetical protein
MIVAIASLAITVLVHLAGAIWWASRMSTQMEAVASHVREMRVDLSAVRAEVHAHDREIAVIQTLQDRAANGSGSSHERAR